jgi:hypothetical protein
LWVPLHQIKFIKGGHGAGREEQHWNEIADFIVDGTIPRAGAAAQDQFCQRLGKISTALVFGLLVLPVAVWMVLMTWIFTGPPTAGTVAALFAVLYSWT